MQRSRWPAGPDGECWTGAGMPRWLGTKCEYVEEPEDWRAEAYARAAQRPCDNGSLDARGIRVVQCIREGYWVPGPSATCVAR